MKRDCQSCKSACCITGKSFSAVMTKAEVDKLETETSNRRSDAANSLGFCHYDDSISAYKMNKFEDASCYFLDAKTNLCTIYNARPLDCKIFPLEYRWFRWMFSPMCKADIFDKKKLLAQLDEYSPHEVRELKLMHLRTPESTRDALWIFLLKILPIAAVFEIYVKMRAPKNAAVAAENLNRTQ